jgi:hypothetical protein
MAFQSGNVLGDIWEKSWWCRVSKRGAFYDRGRMNYSCSPAVCNENRAQNTLSDFHNTPIPHQDDYSNPFFITTFPLLLSSPHSSFCGLILLRVSADSKRLQKGWGDQSCPLWSFAQPKHPIGPIRIRHTICAWPLCGLMLRHCPRHHNVKVAGSLAVKSIQPVTQRLLVQIHELTRGEICWCAPWAKHSTLIATVSCSG